MAKTDVTQKNVDGVDVPAIELENGEILTAQEIGLKIAGDPSNIAKYMQAITDLNTAQKRFVKSEKTRTEAQRASAEILAKQENVVVPILTRLSEVVNVASLHSVLGEKGFDFSMSSGLIKINIELFSSESAELKAFNSEITAKTISFVFDDETGDYKPTLKAQTKGIRGTSLESGLYQVKGVHCADGFDGYFAVNANGTAKVFVNENDKWVHVDSTRFLLEYTKDHSITPKKPNPWACFVGGEWDKSIDGRPFSFAGNVINKISETSDSDFRVPAEDLK